MSERARRLGEIVALGPVIAVVTIERAADALPLADALQAGGMRVLEVTLRSRAALDALAQIGRRYPNLVVGVGTVRRPQDFRAARDAGAQFAVSPGYSAELHAAASEAGVPWLPAVATPSEVLVAQHSGYDLLKFYPAEISGGVAALRAHATVFPDVAFCPTGGITAATAPGYLALPNVACVGGTWVAPRAAVEGKQWSTIQELAATAAALPRGRATVGVGSLH